MAFTGDLEHLHIVDVIQLVHSTRRSGTFSVRGDKGESRIIFSNGHIVAATHLNGKVRIGTVLVTMNALTVEDLRQALVIQKSAGQARKPLLATLISLGKLSQEAASRGLRKLIEMTIVELIGWTKGTFMFDTEDIVVTPDYSYPLSNMEQEISLDAQMVLMDALRVFDEQERDRQSGKGTPADEELFKEVLPEIVTVESGEKRSALTADDLGLSDLEHLERKMPEFSLEHEIFDPFEIHCQKIRETLSGFSAEEQETFVAFLKRSAHRITPRDLSARREGKTQALILLSEDEFIKHSVMAVCKNEGFLVFAADGEKDLDRIIAQCLSLKTMPLLVFDCPETSVGMLSEEKIASLRQQVREKYRQIPIVQMSSTLGYSPVLQAYYDGIRAVFPKPARDARRATFIADAMQCLETFTAYLAAFFDEQKDAATPEHLLGTVKDRMSALRGLRDPAEISGILLQYVAELFERSITFIVRPAELVGERALGVHAEKGSGPTSVGTLKIPLTKPSVFRDVIEKGTPFYGKSDDRLLKEELFDTIGAPLQPTILLLPLKSLGKVIALIYGDFGNKEASAVQHDLLGILADQAGVVMENAFYRKQLSKASPK